MQVEVYSGAEKVQLFLNGKLIGEQPTGREQQFKALFSVPYAPGTLKAVGIRNDHSVAESIITTSSKPTRLRLTPDRATIHADGQDLSFIAVEALDNEGRFQPNAAQDVHFSISGAGSIAAVGNGDGQDEAAYQGDHRKLFQGRALIVVRSSRQPGQIHLTATTSGLDEGAATIETSETNLNPELD